jgi:hypothetical protein
MMISDHPSIQSVLYSTAINNRHCGMLELELAPFLLCTELELNPTRP